MSSEKPVTLVHLHDSSLARRVAIHLISTARSTLIEQLNQSFTYLASIEAAKWLLERHPDHAPYNLNLGTTPGSDIESEDGEVAAETFAATHPDSNDKLRKELEKVRATSARHQYVFYLSPVETKRTSEDVGIVRLAHASIGVR